MTTLKQHGDNFENNPTKSITKIIFWIIGILFLITISVTVIKTLLLPAKTAADVIEKTLDANNVLANYEWFKQQYNDWEAIKSKVQQAENSVTTFKSEAGDRAKWTFEDKEESARLQSIADGLKYQKEDIESKYNARSKMLNRNLFKTNDLPYELN